LKTQIIIFYIIFVFTVENLFLKQRICVLKQIICVSKADEYQIKTSCKYKHYIENNLYMFLNSKMLAIWGQTGSKLDQILTTKP